MEGVAGFGYNDDTLTPATAYLRTPAPSMGFDPGSTDISTSSRGTTNNPSWWILVTTGAAVGLFVVVLASILRRYKKKRVVAQEDEGNLEEAH